MRIEIEFRPDTGPVEILYATVTADQLHNLRAASGDNADPDAAIPVRASTTPGGPERGMVLRCWRIRSVRVIG